MERIEKMRKELKNARQRKSYSNKTQAQRESRLEKMRSSQQTQYGKHSEEKKLRKPPIMVNILRRKNCENTSIMMNILRRTN